MVRRHKIEVAAILEPRVSGSKAKQIIKKLGFNNSIVEDAHGFTGGLWLLWNNDRCQVQALKQTHQFIHVRVTLADHQAFLYTVIYASPREEIRKRLWDDLLQLSEDISVPWLIAGDFNEIAFPSEKRGGSPIDTSRCNKFSSLLTDIKMIDLEGIGQVQVLPRINSDHNPILITLEPSKVDGVERPFRFHSFWLDHQFFNNFIKENWRQDQRTVDSLRDFTPLIKQWNKDVFGNIHHKKNMLIGRLEGIQRAISEQNKSHLEKIEAQGDRNTKYYHTKTIVRRRRSKILELKDDAGNLIREDHNIARVINAYFSKLFYEENHDRPWVQTLWPKVDDETAVNLGAPISKDESDELSFL
ncbi:uncharacterized protein LOC133294307 [Gastrolobium bilobum]|uniref:uncharacterized protein LOC133294307 n=1 Tax=Gastrolobium bilobum TaxID=150636 RepID=UPI002AB0C425|nr:uncharacterized protein LOC133294307 [Gastrolobium bilobum]